MQRKPASSSGGISVAPQVRPGRLAVHEQRPAGRRPRRGARGAARRPRASAARTGSPADPRSAPRALAPPRHVVKPLSLGDPVPERSTQVKRKSTPCMRHHDSGMFAIVTVYGRRASAAAGTADNLPSSRPATTERHMATTEPQTTTRSTTASPSTRSARSRWTRSRRPTAAIPGMPMGDGAGRATCCSREVMQPQPARPALAGPRPLRARRPGTARCCSTRRCTCRATTSRSTTSRTSASGSRSTPGHPEVHHTPGRRDDDRPARPGLRQRGRDGDRRALPARALRRGGAWTTASSAICSDGDLMEGVSAEAASLAGHLGLGRLVYLYDDNHISIDGDTALTSTPRTSRRASSAYGWHTQHVDDVNDLDALRAAIDAGIAEEERPTLIRVRSIIGWPRRTRQGTAGAHGAPLGEDEVRATKEALGWDPDEHFLVPDGVYEHFGQIERGAEAQREWERALRAPGADANAELARRSGTPPGPAGRCRGSPRRCRRSTAARTSSRRAPPASKAMAAFAPFLPTMVGGSADLNESTKTEFPGATTRFSREHGRAATSTSACASTAMGGAVNGMAAARRDRAALRLDVPAVRRLHARRDPPVGAHGPPVAWVYTHDSVGLGEDGPTHQPVEHLAALRAIPGLTVIRPSDANETADRVARDRSRTSTGPARARALAPEPAGARRDARRGRGASRAARTCWPRPTDGGRATLVGTGSEVSLARRGARAARRPRASPTRVVAMP